MSSNKLKNLSFKKKFSYLGLIFLGASLLIIYFALIPTLNKIKTKRSEIVTQKIELEQKLNREKNMASLSAKVKKIEPFVDRLAEVYINQNRELEFITTLEGIASVNNISQSLNLNLDNSNTASGYKTVPLQISASGTYNDLLSYLISLETIKYYINVTSWQFLSSGTTVSSGHSVPDDADQNPPRAIPHYTLRLAANTYWK